MLQADMDKASSKLGPIYWIGWFLIYFAAVVSVLALTGGLIFLLVGAITNPELPALQRGLHGLRLGAELAAKVWAPAISLVLCVMKAYRRSQPAEEPSDEV